MNSIHIDIGMNIGMLCACNDEEVGERKFS